MLQLTSGRFAYLSAPIADDGSGTEHLARVPQARLIQEYGQTNIPLNIVVISDGAKAISARVLETFGTTLTAILASDWTPPEIEGVQLATQREQSFGHPQNPRTQRSTAPDVLPNSNHSEDCGTVTFDGSLVQSDQA